MSWNVVLLHILTAWTFFGKPKFLVKPRRKYSVYLGHSIKLRCPVSGTDAPLVNRTLVAWFKGEKGMNIILNAQPKWSRFSQRNGRHLKILNVHAEDAGIYRCIAKNEFGSVELSVTLKVESTPKPGRGKPPKFKQSPRKKHVYKTGETAKLHCESTGDPDPDVQWFKNGKPFGENERKSVGKGGWVLNLRYLSAKHEGHYSCRVSNNAGSINRTFTVVVKARTMKPDIEEPEKKLLTTRRGRSVKFECKAAGVGDLVFKWKWLGKNANKSIDLEPSNQFDAKYLGNYTRTHVLRFNRVHFDGFLVVREVGKEDEGTYTCLVVNSHGSDTMDFYLQVRGKDKKESTTAMPTVAKPTQAKVQSKEQPIPTVLVAVLTASIIIGMLFIVVLIMCCRKQRKNLEKQYVNEYQPRDVFQPYTDQMHHEMQKIDQNDSRLVYGHNAEPVKISSDARASLQNSQNSLGSHSDSKRTREPTSSSEMYLANSRTSLQTTLCRSCPRETSFDYKGGGSDSLPQRTPPASTPGEHTPGILPPWVSTKDRDIERRKWESGTSLDDSPRNTSPQRSRESIV